MTVKSLDDVRDRRLTWPEHKPRTSHRIKGLFSGHSIDGRIRALSDEMTRWRVRDGHWCVSRNVERSFAGDPAVALWWRDRKDDSLRVLACDKYETQANNAHAILLTLEAMRALERWGAYSAEEAAQGAKALALPPPEGTAINWRTELGDLPPGVAGEDAILIVNGRYRTKAAACNGDGATMLRLNLAVEAARKELGA